MRKLLVLGFAALWLLLGSAWAQSKIVVTPQVLKQSGATWAFTYRYPKMSSPGALMGGMAIMNDFNTQMKKDAQQSLGDFQKEVADWKIVPGMPSMKSTREVSYKVLSKKGIISVKFDEYQMMQGAAHPVTTVITRNFATDAFIHIGDLFAADSPYRPKLSELAGRELQAQARVRHFDIISPDGYAPDARNFEAFGITRDGLKIFFQYAHVGPGAAGDLTVTLPWTALESILKPEIRSQIKEL